MDKYVDVVDTTYPFEPYLLRPDPKCFVFVYNVTDADSMKYTEHLISSFLNVVCILLLGTFSSHTAIVLVRNSSTLLASGHQNRLGARSTTRCSSRKRIGGSSRAKGTAYGSVQSN